MLTNLKLQIIIISIFIFSCLLFCLEIYSQPRIGYSMNAILREFKNQNPKIDTILFQKRIIVQKELYTYYYYFDKNDICVTSILGNNKVFNDVKVWEKEN